MNSNKRKIILRRSIEQIVLTKRVFPSLILNSDIMVQPMTQPIGIKWVMAYVEKTGNKNG